MTQRSAMPELFVQITRRHLDRGNAAGVQQVEEFPASQAEQRGRLTLGETPFLKPAQDRRLPQFLRKLVGANVENVHRLFGKIDCHLPGHEGKLVRSEGRSIE